MPEMRMLCPTQKYKSSPRQFSEVPPPMEYRPGDEIRKVQNEGHIMFKGKMYQISKALGGEHVALRQRGKGSWSIHYREGTIGNFRE